MPTTPQTIGDRFDEKFPFIPHNDNFGADGSVTGGSDISQEVKSFIHSELLALKKRVEGMKKYHKEFECKGANNGRGCYETFCEDQNCRNAPKEFNSAYISGLNPTLAPPSQDGQRIVWI